MIPINRFKKILKVNRLIHIKKNFNLRRKIKAKRKTIDSSGGFILASVTLIFLATFAGSVDTKDKNQIVHLEKTNFRNVFEEKLYWQDQSTPFKLVYNDHVRYYIDLYLDERAVSLKKMLERSEYYFPIFEEYFDKYDLPLELKYLAALESGLNPKAKSKTGAIGLWQFLYSTTNLVELEVTSYIDDRYDVYKSTDAACRYLQYLFRIFGNWELALAAYNDGPGTVERAIIRSGGSKDYWKVRKHLPYQSSEYVPAFIAFNYLFENYKTHGINYTSNPQDKKNVDTVWISGPLNLNDISLKLNINPDEIKTLNPRYKRNFIPNLKEPLYLILPKYKINEFIRKIEKIDTTEPAYEKLSAIKNTEKICSTYVVQKGDFYHKLALKYNCTIEDIKLWNSIDNNDIYPGQSLVIWLNKTSSN